jgi:exodeoxyribonuclease VII small subunit
MHSLIECIYNSSFDREITPVLIRPLLTVTLSFEGSLEELERIVKELEKGDLPLEQSLALFESGMRLSAECKRQLEEAESRIEILMKKGTEVVPVPFDPEKPLK